MGIVGWILAGRQDTGKLLEDSGKRLKRPALLTTNLCLVFSVEA